MERAGEEVGPVDGSPGDGSPGDAPTTTAPANSAPAITAPVIARGARPWRAALVPFVVSRIISAALIAGFAQARAVTPFFGGFGKWDGAWYAEIARSGYWTAYTPGTESPWPFFPLLPWLMHAVHWLGPSELLSGVIIDHLALYVGLAGLYRITSRHFGGRAPALAVWAIALFPASFVFSMVYPSAILFAASVWAFDLVEDRRDLAAGVVAVAATMVRPNGFLIVVALAVAVGRGATVGGWARRAVVTCGPSALAFAAWCAYNRHRTGDALTFYKAKAGWPEIDLVDFLLRDRKIAVPHVLLALAALAVVAVLWRRLPVSWLVLTGLILVVPLLTGMVGLGRYAGETFPPFAAAGELLRRSPPWLRVVVFAGSIALQALCAYWVIRLDYIP